MRIKVLLAILSLCWQYSAKADYLYYYTQPISVEQGGIKYDLWDTEDLYDTYPSVSFLPSFMGWPSTTNFEYEINDSERYFAVVSKQDQKLTGRYTISKSVSYNGDTYNVRSVCDNAFSNTNVSYVQFPNTVEWIGKNCFNGCKSLTKVLLPQNLTIMQKSLFEGCSSLSSIEIPESVLGIYDNCFMQCSSLTSINIPENVDSIGIQAFNDCTNLKYVFVNWESPQNHNISTNAFNNIAYGAILFVPSGTEDIYLSLDWTKPFYQIVDADNRYDFEIDNPTNSIYNLFKSKKNIKISSNQMILSGLEVGKLLTVVDINGKVLYQSSTTAECMSLDLSKLNLNSPTTIIIKNGNRSVKSLIIKQN